MTIKKYMEITGVTKRKYVEKWIQEGLIPGVKHNKNTGEYIFPPSARRPYRSRLKSDSDALAIYTSMLNACLKREHISPATYRSIMNDNQFYTYINELISNELIIQRIEDGIIYYDATLKCAMYKGKNFQEIKKFIIECIKAISYGTTTALCDRTVA